ncbi:hypothetical protein TWF481_000647 [Arthrobotrys musiformis]|uniref:FAD-binding FR-type domain-containing protein n=1 Tax=Arthrobotrys musiformis TaxID=47236 RepID=A0AAV9WTY3_9PEZI
MSPRYPYPTRSSDLDLTAPLASRSNTNANGSTDGAESLNMWWPSSHFNLRPVLSERVSEFIKKNAAAGVNSTVAIAAEGGSHGGDQNAIIDAMEFTRWLGVYYNIGCILLPIGIFVIRKAAGRIKEYKKTQRRKEKESRGRDNGRYKNGNVEISIVETSSTASSSSASSAIIPAEIDSDESKPLLHKDSPGKLPWYTLLYRRFKGFLTYQRPNDARGRVIPHNSILIINQLFFWTSIFLSIYKIYFPLDRANNADLRFFLMADRWGMTFTMNQPLNFILAAKTSPIKYLTGWSYEEHLIVHRMVATTSHVASIIHFVGMYIVYRIFIMGTDRNMTFIDILLRPDIFFGLISFIAFWIFGITSMDEIRLKAYEMFLATHISFASLAMIFLYLHHPAARIYVVFSFLIWATDRIAYRAYNKRWSADSEVQVLDESTMKVTIKNFSQKKSKRMTWEPAGHVFLVVPEWSRLQAHPFTILTPPIGYDLEGNTGDNEKEKEMVLVIRKLEGFTDALYKMGDLAGKDVKVIVDGPYGSEHARASLRKCKKSLFIAGGSGIAVAWPLLCELVRREIDKNRKGKGGKPKKIVLVWIVHHEHHLNWIHDDLEKLEEAKRTLPRDFEIEVRKFITRGVNGKRPDLRKEVIRIVEDEDGTKLDGRTGVLVCGPDAMMREVREVGRDLLWEGKDVEILAEKFGW